LDRFSLNDAFLLCLGLHSPVRLFEVNLLEIIFKALVVLTCVSDGLLTLSKARSAFFLLSESSQFIYCTDFVRNHLAASDIRRGTDMVLPFFCMEPMAGRREGYKICVSCLFFDVWAGV
jgi:hypothetical protein